MFFISKALLIYKTVNAIVSWSKEGDLITTHDQTFKLGIKTNKRLVTAGGKIILTPDGELTIKMGFEFNACSFVPDGKLLDENDCDTIPISSSTGKIPVLWLAPLIHDALYELLVIFGKDKTIEIFTRKEADRCFRDAMIEAGERPRALLYYYGLRLFGGNHIRKIREQN